MASSENSGDADIDALTIALVSVTKELWISKERNFILERLLLDKGVIKANEIDTYEPGGQFGEQLGAMRQDLIDGVVSTLVHKNVK